MNENKGLFEKLLQRQSEIDKEIFILRAKIVELSQEAVNIKTTTKIVGDLIGVSVGELNSPTSICEIISSFLYKKYPMGMTSGEIFSKVRSDFKPHILRTSVSPIISRMKKRGHLVDMNGFYVLSPNEFERIEKIKHSV